MSDHLSALLARLVLNLSDNYLQGLVEALQIQGSFQQLSLLKSRFVQSVPYLWQKDLECLFLALQQKEITPQAVILALQTALAVVRQQRQAQQLELVWTGPDSGVSTRQTAQVVKEVIQSAVKSLWIVSFTLRDISSLAADLNAALERGVLIRCIFEDKQERQQHKSMGELSLKALKDAGIFASAQLELFIWPQYLRQRYQSRQQGYTADSLHAKCLLADQQKLLITSANLTRMALTQNMELGVLIAGGEQPQTIGRHFQALIDKDILLPLPKESQDEKS